MKVLLTGATGFLGKQVLRVLLEDERVTCVDVVSRRKQTHPSPKVRMLNVDLSDPACGNAFSPDTDAVIHLAGLYDFRAELSDNYTDNVLPALHVLSQVRAWNQKRPVPLFYSSTYAVGFGGGAPLEEVPIERLPSKSIPYAYTKAVSEKAVTDSGVPGAVFRLGVLVGTAETGEIDKLDGPYALMRLLYRIGSVRGSRLLRRLPVPANPAGLLPLVPVDVAALAFKEALFNPDRKKSMRIIGVYDPASVPLGELCEFLFAELLPGTRPAFVSRVPLPLLRAQARVTGIPASVFQFSLDAVSLGPSSFESEFPQVRLPAFSSYRDRLVNGFLNYMEGRPE